VIEFERDRDMPTGSGNEGSVDDPKGEVYRSSGPRRPRSLLLLGHGIVTPAAAGENKTSSDGPGDDLRADGGTCQDRVVDRDCKDDLNDDAWSERWLRISAIACR
jgi:hypothetical protein